MSKMRNNFLKFFLRPLFAKQCPPSLGWRDETSKRDCYYVYVLFDSKKNFVMRGYNDNCVFGKSYYGDRFSVDASIPLRWLNPDEFVIDHHYLYFTFTYFGLKRYILYGFTRINMLRAHIVTWWRIVSQFFFNKQRLVMKQRHELLRHLVQRYIDSTHSGFDALDIMTGLYSTKWVLHPKRETVEKKLELYLQSLVESGELHNVNTEYVLTGKAIITLEKYEIEERRHKDNIRNQRGLIIITVILALFALIQAEVIKLPILLDFTK